MTTTRHLAYAILQFLDSEVSSGAQTPDTIESLEVAMECLGTAYGINLDQTHLRTQPGLMELFTANATPGLEQKKTEEVFEKAEKLKAEGNEFMKQELYEDAVQKYSAAIETDNTNAVYFSNRAAAYNKLEDFKKAIDDCDEALRIDENYSKAYGRKGLALSSIGAHKEAVECYKKALQIEPTNESYKNNMEIAEEKMRAAEAGGFPSASGFSNFLNNPAFVNLAQTFMQNPAMQQMVSSVMSQSAPEAGTAGEGDSMEMLLRAGQRMAQQMQQDNPDLVENLRSQYEQQTQPGDDNPPPGNPPPGTS